MDITCMEGFRQIPADEELCDSYGNTENVISALRENGVTLISNFTTLPTSMTRSTLTVNNVARTGLKMMTPSGLRFYWSLPDISLAAVQYGFRLTLGEGAKNLSQLVEVGGEEFSVDFPEEAASYYYEIFVSFDGNNTVTAALYCNRDVVDQKSFTASVTDNLTISIGNAGRIFSTDVASGTVMIGDMYSATVAYGEDNSATPSLLGSIEVQYSPVASFSGDQHVTTDGQDAVTVLNSSGPGYLMLAPTTQAGEITFSDVDVSGKEVIAAMVSVVYQGASAPNNYLAMQVSSGGVSYPLKEENGETDDQGTWTTATDVHMSPPDGGEEWGNSLNFSVDLYNRSR